MKLEQSFDVDAPLERVWSALIDVEQVAPCLPGASVTGRNDDGTYNGTFTIKIGPTTASYAGKLEMEEIDESSHLARMQANGTDRRGQGGAKATIISKLSQTGTGATRVDVDTDYQITGRLARFGRGGMIEDISQRLLREFAQRLQASLAGGTDGGAEGAPAATTGEGAPPPPGEGAPAATTGEGAPPPPPSPQSPAEPQGEIPPPGPEPEPPPEPAPPPFPPPEPPPPPPQPVEPFDAGSVAGSVMWERVKRNPAPLAFVLGVLLALVLFRRGRDRS